MPSSTLPDELLAHEGSDRGGCEHLADDRGALQDRALDRGQAVESRRDQAPGRWAAPSPPTDHRRRPIGRPPARDSHRRSASRPSLRRTEGCLRQPRRRAPTRRRRPPSHRSDRRRARPSRLRVSGSNRIEVAFATPPPQPDRSSRSSGRACARTRIGASRDHSADVLHQIEERRLGPLEIVEEQQERSIGSEDLQEPPERPERLLDRRLASRRGRRGTPTRSAIRSDRSPGPITASSFRCASSGVVQDRESRRLAHQLDDRPERDALPVGEAPAAEDGRVRIDLRCELLDQPRLPGTGRSQDREEMAGAIRRHALERLPEQRQLAVAADHRRIQSAGVAGDTGRDVLESIGGDRLRLPLGRDRIGRLRPDRVAGQPIRLVTDQDLAGSGRLLEAGRGVDGVARSRAPARSWIARDDLAGVHPDPRGERDAVDRARAPC